MVRTSPSITATKVSARATHSFELFPPRTPEGVAKLSAVVRELATAKPAYFSVTFGAGGSNQSGTYETVMQVVQNTGIEGAPHLTCVGSTRSDISALLERYKAAGLKRIVALRGDLPGTTRGSEAPGEFHYANELVAHIREVHGDYFRLEVAAYPEMHPQASDPDADFEHFLRKVRAGADAAITQYFYNAGAYEDFLDRCTKAGVGIPVIPGIMPITNFAQLTRFSDTCGADIPRFIRKRLEAYGDDLASIRAFGLEVVTRLCERLLALGVPGLHFYTLNQSGPTLNLVNALGLSGSAPVPAGNANIPA